MLEVIGINKHFRGVHALKNVTSTFYDGEIHGLVGENGAGKSTLMKCVAGVYHPDSGVIKLDGKEVHFESPIDAYKAGVRIVHQELSLIRSLSIAENIYIHQFRNAGPLKAVQRKALEAKAQAMLEEWNIHVDASQLVSQISMGVRQLVEIARELSSGGKLIILDEPTSSLTFKEIEQLFTTLLLLKSKGYAIIFISHRLSEVMELVDRVTVLRDGEMMATEEKKNLSPRQMVNLCAGKQMTTLFPKTECSIDGVALQAKGISGEGFNKLDLQVHWGEILGIAGLVGAGRSELVRAIYGVNPLKSGEIFIEGKPVVIKNALDAVRNDIGFLSESRGIEGIFPEMSVSLNLVVLKIKDIVKGLFMNTRKINDKTQRLVKSLNIVSADPVVQKISELSGGNQQKVVLGRLLGSTPRILILDEPTRGVDVGNKCEIHSIIGNFVKAGGAVIMVSSEIDEVIGVSDRIMVLCEGEHVSTFNREDFDKEELLLCMMNLNQPA